MKFVLPCVSIVTEKLSKNKSKLEIWRRRKRRKKWSVVDFG